MTLCVSPVEPPIGGAHLNSISSSHSSSTTSLRSSPLSSHSSPSDAMSSPSQTHPNGIPRTRVANGVTIVENNVPNNEEPELCRITPNSIYLTFNAPQVDEYHRTIFMTGPLPGYAPTPIVSGMMHHASYIREPAPPQWILESRAVEDLSKSKTLVLLYRIAEYVNQDMAALTKKFEDVLRSVPLGKEEREKRIGPCVGHPKLGGYDCIIWTGDALEALVEAGLLDFGNKTAAQVVAETRALAGPPDARTMVGVHQPLRVLNP